MTEYHTYLPFVATPPMPIVGLACTYRSEDDFARLGTKLYYHWSCDPSLLWDPRYIPMSRNGDMPDLPEGYSGYLLVFNEPNVSEPGGCDMTPEQCAPLYDAICERYPAAKIIATGLSYINWNGYIGSWIDDFIPLIKILPYAWSLHAYYDNYGMHHEALEEWIIERHETLGTEIWVTEWADTSGNNANNEAFASWMDKQPWIKAWFYFCNRIDWSQPWTSALGNWKLDLFDYTTGVPTPRGEWMMDYISRRK